MKESIYKTYDELPLFLNAETVAKVLGVSPSSGYELMHEPDFPALRIGSRIVIPKEAFIRWVEERRYGVKKYDLYSKREPAKNFSPLPNEVFYLGLSYGAIAVYGYLMHIEGRKTFQSYAGYNTIGRAVKMSANTVRKCVLELEDKHLIRTETTTVVTRDGRKRNGTLRYHIRLIQEAMDYYCEQQLRRLKVDTERQRA